MNKLKQLWAFFQGKKCIIANCYWEIWAPILLILYPNPATIPVLLYKITAIIGIIFSGIGLGSRWAKVHASKKEQEMIDKE